MGMRGGVREEWGREGDVTTPSTCRSRAHPSTKVTSVSDGRPLFIVAVTDFVRLHESGLTRS